MSNLIKDCLETITLTFAPWFKLEEHPFYPKLEELSNLSDRDEIKLALYFYYASISRNSAQIRIRTIENFVLIGVTLLGILIIPNLSPIAIDMGLMGLALTSGMTFIELVVLELLSPEGLELLESIRYAQRVKTKARQKSNESAGAHLE